MDDERWDVFLIPLSTTGEEALSYAEARELTQDMSPDEYAREMECSFDAPVEGAYFAEALNALALQGRVCAAPVDLSSPVITAWDLGVHDYCSIWWWQIVGKEIHFVDYEMAVGKGLDHWASVIRKKALAGGYEYRCHLLPHDIEAREISSAKSRRATLSELIPHDEPIITVPRIRSKEDSIHAARAMLGSAWFDAEKCKTGLAMLRGYHKSAMGQPVHGPGPHSHGADAFQTAAVGFHLVSACQPRCSGAARCAGGSGGSCEVRPHARASCLGAAASQSRSESTRRPKRRTSAADRGTPRTACHQGNQPPGRGV